MKDSDRYLKFVEWSLEDNCYVGTAPGLMHGGCDGDDERMLYAERCDRVDEIIELYHADGDPLPPATAGRGFVEKLAQAA